MGVGQGPGGDHLNVMSADTAFAAYEAVRGRLPPARRKGNCRAVETLDDLTDDFDLFLLDAFGVLNIGETAIPGAVDRVASLKRQGKTCLVVTNAAGYPHEILLARYSRLGFSFQDDEVISSRSTLIAALQGEDLRTWGMMASRGRGLSGGDGVEVAYLEDDPAPYAEVDAFLLLGSAEWNEARQARLEAALIDKPRPVWVGNPDIVAPRENGFSIEPGHFAHRLADRTGVTPRFFGKPFPDIFELAFASLKAPIDRSRALMVGDSLHTDILGAQTAKVASALVAGYGFFAGHDIDASIAQAGIAPDFILKRP